MSSFQTQSVRTASKAVLSNFGCFITATRERAIRGDIRIEWCRGAFVGVLVTAMLRKSGATVSAPPRKPQAGCYEVKLDRDWRRCSSLPISARFEHLFDGNCPVNVLRKYL